jgi:hypothetical protein
MISVVCPLSAWQRGVCDAGRGYFREVPPFIYKSNWNNSKTGILQISNLAKEGENVCISDCKDRNELSVSFFIPDCSERVFLDLWEHVVKHSTFSGFLFIFKGMKSPVDHNESEGLPIDMFPLGVVRMLVCRSPQAPGWVYCSLFLL